MQLRRVGIMRARPTTRKPFAPGAALMRVYAPVALLWIAAAGRVTVAAPIDERCYASPLDHEVAAWEGADLQNTVYSEAPAPVPPASRNNAPVPRPLPPPPGPPSRAVPGIRMPAEGVAEGDELPAPSRPVMSPLL